jgi:hypothetical protein
MRAILGFKSTFHWKSPPVMRQSAPINRTLSHPHHELRNMRWKTLSLSHFLLVAFQSLTDIHKHTLINKKPHTEHRALNYICTIASMKYVFFLFLWKMCLVFIAFQFLTRNMKKMRIEAEMKKISFYSLCDSIGSNFLSVISFSSLSLLFIVCTCYGFRRINEKKL